MRGLRRFSCRSRRLDFRDDPNGNGYRDFADVVLSFTRMQWIAANEPIEAFDLNRNDRIDFAIIVALFSEI